MDLALEGRFLVGGIVSLVVAGILTAIDKRIAYIYILIISLVVVLRYYPSIFSGLNRTLDQIGAIGR